PEIVQRSIVFGREIANAIYEWSESDGYKNASNPFSAPADKIGPGFWVPPATPSVQSIPYWKNLRRMVAGSEQGAGLPAPPTYSTDPNSAFYKMV
ncbi:PA-phosphatase, partial [Flavihumibacter sediminis]|nr:PA-phosphatase [Flavihumibacter sediminis]